MIQCATTSLHVFPPKLSLHVCFTPKLSLHVCFTPKTFTPCVFHPKNFTSQDLEEDWRQGAALFESLLLDCDAAVNYCNWNYFAGVGNDPRNRKFKTVSQGETYDAEALLAKQWVPELAGLPTALRHRPWLATGGVPGYPAPLVDPAGHIKAEVRGKGRHVVNDAGGS